MGKTRMSLTGFNSDACNPAQGPIVKLSQGSQDIYIGIIIKSL